MNVRSEIDIRAPRPLVFDVFRDLDAAERRITGIEKIEVLEGPARLEVGTRWQETRKMMGKAATEVMWVTSLEKDTSYHVEADSQGTKYETTYTFTDIPEGTRVAVDFRGTPVSMLAKVVGVFGFLFAGAARKMLYADLEDLRDACEAEAQASPQ